MKKRFLAVEKVGKLSFGDKCHLLWEALQLISLLIATSWVLTSQMRTALVEDNVDIRGINCNAKQMERRA